MFLYFKGFKFESHEDAHCRKTCFDVVWHLRRSKFLPFFQDHNTIVVMCIVHHFHYKDAYKIHTTDGSYNNDMCGVISSESSNLKLLQVCLDIHILLLHLSIK